MKIINSKMHGILDYSIVFLLSIAPYLFDMNEDSIHCRLLMVTGLLLLLSSLLTDFEFFLVKVFSFKTHLKIDFILGSFLAISPLIFNLSGNSILPHIILGITVMALSLITKTGKEESKENTIQEELQEIKG